MLVCDVAGEGCADKPLCTLWKNYTSSAKPDVHMKVTVTQAGLKAVTKEHGLTEYWSHRITYCAAPPNYPKVHTQRDNITNILFS